MQQDSGASNNSSKTSSLEELFFSLTGQKSEWNVLWTSFTRILKYNFFNVE